MTANDSLSNTVQLIRTHLPEFDRITKDIRSSAGYFVLPNKLITILSIDGLLEWSSLYAEPEKLNAVTASALIGPENVQKLDKKVRHMDERQKLEIREVFKEQVLRNETLHYGLESFRIPTETDLTTWLEDTLAGRGGENSIKLYLFLYSMITQLFNYLAVMSYARTMTTLVKNAIRGDDECYFNAVRTDKTVLFGIPYFKSRLIRAQFEGDLIFFQKLSTAIRGTSLGSKISHRRLMFVFALLDDENLLDMPLEQLLDVCNEVGVTEISDIESLRKRRKYYRERTGRQIKF